MVNGEKRIYHYDAEHERKRKEQLRRLFDRTQEQVIVNAIFILHTVCININFPIFCHIYTIMIFITAY